MSFYKSNTDIDQFLLFSTDNCSVIFTLDLTNVLMSTRLNQIFSDH